MAVHISRIEIRNFRNFRHLVLDPFPATAVIVGENGVGKSNLLHALRLILDPRLSDADRQLRAEDIWEGAPPLAQGVEVSVSIELRGFDDDDDAKAVLDTSTVQWSPYVARLTYRYFPRPDVNIETAEPENGDENSPLTPVDYDYVVYGGDSESSDVRRVRRGIGLRVLHALRDAESDLQVWRRNPLRNLLERLPLDGANLATTATAIDSAVDQLRLDPSVGTLEHSLTDRLGSMTGPRMPLTPTLGFASSDPDELVRAVRLFIDPARRHQIADASLGSANVLYLGLLLEVLEQQRQEDDFVTTILAVEEPEAHLHVSLQRKLFGYLLRSEPTLLLTTHSPHIAAVAPLRSLVVLRSTHTVGTVGHTTAGIQLAKPEQEADLERYLDVSRAEVLFASAIILVEGLAELYIIPALANAAGFDLDSYGIVVASVHGTDFDPYTRLLGERGLDSRWILITDGDPDASSAGWREAGIRRAIRVVHDEEARDQLDAEITALVDDPEATDYADRRQRLVDALAEEGLFVGETTLEVDMCDLLRTEMLGAYEDLVTASTRRARFARAVRNEAREEPDSDLRAGLLRRIEAIGKGRYAQRVAGHIEKLNLIDVLDDLDGAGRARYLLDALDHLSRVVRHRPLLSDAASSSGDTIEN